MESNSNDNKINYVELFMSKFSEFMKDMGYANLLIAGKTGVGKSTLMNACFREDLATVGIGEPVTDEIRCYEKKGFPLRIYDTVGFELTNFEKCKDEIYLEELISKTSDLLPEAQKKALAMVQKINLEMKEKEAYNIVRVYCATNTVASFIPWGDVIAILPSNIAMLVQITKLYEFNASKDFLELIVAECFTFIIARLPVMGVANLINIKTLKIFSPFCR